MTKTELNKILAKINKQYRVDRNYSPYFYNKIERIFSKQTISNTAVVQAVKKALDTLSVIYMLFMFLYILVIVFTWQNFHYFYISNILLVLLNLFVKLAAEADKGKPEIIQQTFQLKLNRFFIEPITPAGYFIIWNNALFLAIYAGRFWLGFLFVFSVFLFTLSAKYAWTIVYDIKQNGKIIRQSAAAIVHIFNILGVFLSVFYSLYFSKDDFNQNVLNSIYLSFGIFAGYFVISLMFYSSVQTKTDKNKFSLYNNKKKAVKSLFNTRLGEIILDINQLDDELQSLKLKQQQFANQLTDVENQADKKLHGFLNSELKIPDTGVFKKFEELKKFFPLRTVKLTTELHKFYKQKLNYLNYQIKFLGKIIEKKKGELNKRISIAQEYEELEKSIRKEKLKFEKQLQEDDRINKLIIDVRNELEELNKENINDLGYFVYDIDNEADTYSVNSTFRVEQDLKLKSLRKRLDEAKKETEFYNSKMKIYNELVNKYIDETDMNDFESEMKVLFEDFNKKTK